MPAEFISAVVIEPELFTLTIQPFPPVPPVPPTAIVAPMDITPAEIPIPPLPPPPPIACAKIPKAPPFEDPVYELNVFVLIKLEAVVPPV